MKTVDQVVRVSNPFSHPNVYKKALVIEGFFLSYTRPYPFLLERLWLPAELLPGWKIGKRPCSGLILAPWTDAAQNNQPVVA